MEEKEIKNTLKKLSDKIELAKKEAKNKGFSFVSRTRKELEEKLRSVNTPFIGIMAWKGVGHISDTFTHEIGVFNPDPVFATRLVGHLSFGPASLIANNNTALLSAYANFPRLYQEYPAIPSGDLKYIIFNYHFPITTVTLSPLHLGNVLIFKNSTFETGSIIDRACTPVRII